MPFAPRRHTVLLAFAAVAAFAVSAAVTVTRADCVTWPAPKAPAKKPTANLPHQLQRFAIRVHPVHVEADVDVLQMVQVRQRAAGHGECVWRAHAGTRRGTRPR